jgi:hypothetical protein
MWSLYFCLYFIRKSDSFRDAEEEETKIVGPYPPDYGSVRPLRKCPSLPPNFFSELVENSVSVYDPLPQDETKVSFENSLLEVAKEEDRTLPVYVEQLWETDPK